MGQTQGQHPPQQGLLYAILSDIHANYPALKAVAADARKLARKEDLPKPIFVCLGDVVDYGPHPNRCVAWVHRYARITIQGNHDEEIPGALYREPALSNVARKLWPILLWTRRRLKLSHKKTIGKWQPELRSPAGLESFTLFHGSLIGNGDPIGDTGNALRSFEKLGTRYGLFGHTHYQCRFQEERLKGRGKTPKLYLIGKDELGEWQSLSWRRTLLNPGSVGQSRRHASAYRGADRNPSLDYRAAYMLLHVHNDGQKYQFRRVDYDCSKTVNDLKRVRWQGNGAKPSSGNDILHAGQEKNRPCLDQDYLDRLPGLLRDLVDGALIPQLACKAQDGEPATT